MSYKVSDEVVCKIKDNRVVSANSKDYDTTIVLEVLSVDDAKDDDVGYLLFVPSKYSLHESIRINALKLKEYEIEPRFLDSSAVYIFDSAIVRLYMRRDGMCCSKCEEFYHLAAANQEDGTLVCYLCRQNPFRNYKNVRKESA